MNTLNIITGDIFEDQRGQVKYINNFDLKEVKRIYSITPADVKKIRAWQGHELEKKWFLVTKGSFEFKFIKVENWKKPELNLKKTTIILSENDSKVIELPGGYVNGFKALKKNSTVMIFSNFNLEESKNDDYRFPIEYWDWNK